ncbi:unnamed protein product [Lampetra fluviatilis]
MVQAVQLLRRQLRAGEWREHGPQGPRHQAMEKGEMEYEEVGYPFNSFAAGPVPTQLSERTWEFERRSARLPHRLTPSSTSSPHPLVCLIALTLSSASPLPPNKLWRWSRRWLGEHVGKHTERPGHPRRWAPL